jgi:cation diffusion facilitator family transporter
MSSETITRNDNVNVEGDETNQFVDDESSLTSEEEKLLDETIEDTKLLVNKKDETNNLPGSAAAATTMKSGDNDGDGSSSTLQKKKLGSNKRAPRRIRTASEEDIDQGKGDGFMANSPVEEGNDNNNVNADSKTSSGSLDENTQLKGQEEEEGGDFSTSNSDTNTNSAGYAAEPNEIPPPEIQTDSPILDGEVAGPSSLGGEIENENGEINSDTISQPSQPSDPPSEPSLEVIPSLAKLPRLSRGGNGPPRGPRMLAEIKRGSRERRGNAPLPPLIKQEQVRKTGKTEKMTLPENQNNLSPSASPSEVTDQFSPSFPSSSSSPLTNTKEQRVTMRSMGDKAARSVLKQAQKIRSVVEKHERSSVFLAGLLMACAAWINTMRRRLERQLAEDTKMGHVKLHGIVLITASILWAPVALLRWSISQGATADSETRAVAEALDALSKGAQVGKDASNSVLEVANLKLANTADAVLLHAGPGILWFIFVAAIFGIVHHVLAEWATDYLQFGSGGILSGSSGGGGGGGGTGKNGTHHPSIVAVLTGQASGGTSSALGNISSGSGVSLPQHSNTSGVSGSGGGGAGAVKSLQGGTASSPDSPFLRTFAMVCTFSSAVTLAWLTGWGYQNSILLWFGAAIFSLGIAGSAGLESSQFERVFGALLRSSNPSSSSSSSSSSSILGGVLSLFISSLSICWNVVSGEGNRTYSAEAGGLVPGSAASKAWFSGKDSGIGGIPDAAPPSVSFATAARKVLKHILDDSNSRKIFYFLCINFSFMFVEIIGGYFTNSLGLISDAGHMFFDNASLFIGLYASYMSRWRSDAIFTYGYSRYEVLAGFVNAVFLVFIGVSVVVEGISRLWQPPDIHTEHLLPISVAGLGVNIIGLIFFHDVAHAHGHGGGGDEGGGHGGDCDGHHGHSHGGGGANENMMGVYLHVLADALGSIGVIISSLMIKYWGWKLADPIASIIISGLILASVVPLLNVTVGPLLQRVPEGSEGKLRAACATLAKSSDIARIENVHFWKLRGDTTVGTLHVIARKEADEQKVLRRVQAQFKSLGVMQLTAQIERDDTVTMVQGSSGSN